MRRRCSECRGGGEGRRGLVGIEPAAVMRFLRVYVNGALAPECEVLPPDTTLFWSNRGERTVRRTRAPMTPKNVRRLGKT